MLEDLKKLENYLSKYDKFVISTHESPDWDGLGAEMAFYEFLKNIGKKPMIINSDPTLEAFLEIDTDNYVNVASESFEFPEDITEYAQFVLDTNDYDNIGPAAYDFLKDKVRDLFIIDHHEGDAAKFETNIIKADASSACEIIYQIISYYEQQLSLKSAQALFAGIVFDTGSFVYPKTSAETFHIASNLVELGVKPYWIHELIYEQNALTSFELKGRILSSMEVLHGGRLIAMKLTPKMLQETGASFSEGEFAINMPLTVKGVTASILVKKDYEGPVKVSMRTKGDNDVAKIAMDNGGGGHKNAAGYKSNLNLEKTYESAIKNLDEFFK